MPISQEGILKQLDALIAEAGKFQQYWRQGQFGDEFYSKIPGSALADFLTRVVAAIERLAPSGSAYVQTLRETRPTLDRIDARRIDPYVGILKALRVDYDVGYLQSVTELIHADLFADFLEMADHLLDQGYKDPAAVITGSVLEEHLRKLCDKNSIIVSQGGKPKKADTLNAELAGANVYSKLDQKNVTAWLDLRNKAAHGKYSEYTKDQVALLIQSVRDFITRNPA
ncbi:MAG: hypothetical protein ACRD5H_10745 [Nitrososphaerales archaeon]